MQIRFENLGKTWPDGTRALHDISLEVPSGQFCVLLGHSGAGKSTLLRCVNGLDVPTSGKVVVDGRPVQSASLRALRRRIGMVHQHFGLVPRASGAANVLAGAAADLPLWRVLGGFYPARLKRSACELMAAVGLEEAHLHRRAEKLSGGQQQRLGIARAFILDPAIILADEPVASLDPSISRDVLALLRRQAEERGSTVLCSLHQVDLARAFADRIVALHKGRVIFDGPPSALDATAISAIYTAAPQISPRVPECVPLRVLQSEPA